jgi:hypothetical protein
MSKETKQELFISDRKEAFNNLRFNIKNEGHVLYTASEDHCKLVPYKFGDEYVSEYRPYNSYISFAKDEKVKDIINQVYMINELLKGEEFSSIIPLDIDDAKACIYGHGWVVYTDSRNKIHEFIIDKDGTVVDGYAKEELQEYYDILKPYFVELIELDTQQNNMDDLVSYRYVGVDFDTLSKLSLVFHGE